MLLRSSFHHRSVATRLRKRPRSESASLSTSVLANLSLSQASAGIHAGEILPSELLEATICRMESTRGLNAFITESLVSARTQALASDQRQKNGSLLGPLDGVTIAVKDNFCTDGIQTTCGSKALTSFISPYESAASGSLLASGAVMVGKTNMDEFGMGSATVYSHHGPTLNPWGDWPNTCVSRSNDGVEYVAGGSSGGSAAAVAVGACFGALGSDTGGSIRQPAAYCGIVGLKPSYGRLSRHGLVAYASSLDTPGVLARDVRDAALLLDGLCQGANETVTDSTAAVKPPPLSAAAAVDAGQCGDRPLEGLVVGIPDEYHVEGMAREVLHMWDDAIGWMKDAGATTVRVSLPHTRVALPSYYVLACAEAASNLARYDGVRYGHRETPAVTDTVAAAASESNNSSSSNTTPVGAVPPATDLHALYTASRTAAFGGEVQRRILCGNFVLSAGAFSDYYERATAARAAVRADFAHVFEAGVDVLLMPTSPTPAFPLRAVLPPSSSSASSNNNRQGGQGGGGGGEEEDVMEPVQMFAHDVMTIPASLAGLPAISIPCGMASVTTPPTAPSCGGAVGGHPLPLGMQLVAGRMCEETLLRAASALEAKAAFQGLITDVGRG